ncbi:MAG: response regulator [Pseudomonadota bacterium]
MKILVVDDSKAMRMIVKKTLRDAGYGGHDIVEASDGQEGLDVFFQEDPDLVLSDWNMPNMTGPEFLKALNDQGATTKFGFVTTEATPPMRSLADELGARFLIAKPFTATSFVNALEPVIGS